MVRSTILILASLFTLLAPARAHACSVFMMSDRDHVYVGNNEDDPPTKEFANSKITFSPAGEGRKLGSMFYSFDDGFPQGGMNTSGLFLDFLQLPHQPSPTYPPGVADYPGGPVALVRHVLESCSTVEEATRVLKKYRLPGIEDAQMIVGDRNGHASVIGVGADGKIAEKKKKNESFFLALNYNANNPKENYPDAREPLARDYWAKKPDVTKQNARTMLSALHFEGLPSTLYSNLYDLKRGDMYLYNFHNYADPVKINLQAELAKHGARTVEMKSLFPVTPYAVKNTEDLRCCVSQLKGKLEEGCASQPVCVPGGARGVQPASEPASSEPAN